MTDQLLRALERTAAESGALDDRVALLRARRRAGELTGECPELTSDPLRHVPGVESMTSLRCPICGGTGRVSLIPLLAYLGVEEARVEDPGVAGDPDGSGDYCLKNIGASGHGWPDRFPLWEWTRWMFDRWPSIYVRAALIASKLVLPKWERGRAGPADLRPRRAVETVEAWLYCPCEEHRKACVAAAHQVFHIEWAQVAFAAAESGITRRDACRVTIQAAARQVGEPEVREAIERDLIAWVGSN